MSNFKNVLLCFAMLSCLHLKSEDKFEVLDQKIKNLEVLIISIAQNMSLQQDFIQLLQKQLEVNIVIGEDDEIIVEDHSDDNDHRLTLRIPKSLMAKIDIKRKQRIGKISRNLWILETLDEATRK